MNAAFKQRVASAGIDFGRFLLAVTAALAEVNNPRFATLIGQGATILDAHISTLDRPDNSPATVGEVATAEKDGGFPGAGRPGSPSVAVNGHHEDTHAANRAAEEQENADRAAQVAPIVPASPTAPVAAPTITAAPTLENRVANLEGNISQILTLLTQKAAPESNGSGV